MTIRQDVARVISNWMNPQYMRLHAGEMSAQEVRTARAIVKVVGWEIDQILWGQEVPQATATTDEQEPQPFNADEQLNQFRKEHPE